MQFNTLKREKVIVKARGKFISKAVDVVEVTRKRFLNEITVEAGNILINSEEFTNQEGKPVRVSTIEIYLGRK